MKLKNGKKNIFIVVVIIAFIFLFFITNQIIANQKDEANDESVTYIEDDAVSDVTGVCPFFIDKIRVAACPTFYEDIVKLDTEKFDLIFTDSTSDSLYLLSNNKTDVVLSGRILMPGEGNFKKEVLTDSNSHYSFLSNFSRKIYVSDFDLYDFYTDLDINKVKDDLGIKKVSKVLDVYEHLGSGVIITSWNNTDLERSEIVHVLNDDNSRLKISRIPTAYYKDDCDKQTILEIKNLFTK